MTKYTRIALIALVLTVFSASLFSMQHTVSLRGGVSLPFTDMNEELDLNPMFGLSYEAWLKDNISLGLYPYYTKLSGERAEIDGDDNVTGTYEATLIGGDIQLKYRPVEKGVINFDGGILRRIAPFANLGLGLAHYSTEADFDSPATKADYEESKLALVAPSAGLGISFLTKWNVNLDLGVQYDYAWDDKIDGFDDDNLGDSYLMPYLSLGYTFGHSDKSAAGYRPRKILRDKVSMKKDFQLSGVQFEFDSANLTPEAKNVLRDVVAAMKAYPKAKLDVQGHTDNTGNSQYNYDLSVKRAESVKKFLVENGINDSRLSTKGFGETRPVASNDTEEGRAENRRIEFVVVK